MNILLTGGTGFIGSYVARELVGKAHPVTILARNPAKVPALVKIPQIEIVPGRITDQKLLAQLVIGKDACLHAALNYTRQSGWQVLLDDTLPTVVLSDAAAQANVTHFIYTTSAAVNDSLYKGGGDSPEERIKIAAATAKLRPAAFCGATKAASENYPIAQSYRSKMRVNIIRPGCAFGNPALPGGNTRSDTRFCEIIHQAVPNLPIPVTKNDGTQFIFAGDLARLYRAVLESKVNRKTFYGLGKHFVSWHEVAVEAGRRSGSRSEVTLEDKGWSDDGSVWDVSDMKVDFGLEFDARQKIGEHPDYSIDLERKALEQ